jgi:hypothetical protein
MDSIVGQCKDISHSRFTAEELDCMVATAFLETLRQASSLFRVLHGEFGNGPEDSRHP